MGAEANRETHSQVGEDANEREKEKKKKKTDNGEGRKKSEQPDHAHHQRDENDGQKGREEEGKQKEEEEDKEEPLPSLREIETRLCPFHPSYLILLDDVFTSNSTSLKHDIEEAKRQKLLRANTLQFLSALTTKLSHHLRIHVALVSQLPLSTSGNSSTANTLRIIRSNLDTLILFPQALRDVRTILQSLFSGSEYQFVKKVYMETIEDSPLSESPQDARLFRPYVAITLNPHANKSLRFR